MVSVTTQVFHGSAKAVLERTQTNDPGYVLVKLGWCTLKCKFCYIISYAMKYSSFDFLELLVNIQTTLSSWAM